MSSRKRRWPETPGGVEVFELRETVELLEAANETLVNANRELAERNTEMATEIVDIRLRALTARKAGEVTPDLVRLLRSRFAIEGTYWHLPGAIVLEDGTAVFQDGASMAVIPAYLGPHTGLVDEDGSTKEIQETLAGYLRESDNWEIERVEMPAVGLMPGGMLPAPLGGNARFEFIEPCICDDGAWWDGGRCFECGGRDLWDNKAPYTWPIPVGRRFYQMHYLLRIADLPGLSVWEPVAGAVRQNGHPIPLYWKAGGVHGFIMPLSEWEVGKR